MSWMKLGCALVVALWAGACTPTFDWRESRPSAGLSLLFPCKPDRVMRQVAIAGRIQPMTLWSCKTGDLTFAVSRIDAADPARLTPTLQALRNALVANVAMADPAARAVALATTGVAGSTPHSLAERLVLRGHLADGTPLEVQGQFFCRGLQVYQATMLGGRLDPQALDMFFSSLKLSS